MTIDRFIATLPSDPAEALEQIEGAFWGDRMDPQMTAEDRVKLLRRQAELQRKVRK